MSVVTATSIKEDLTTFGDLKVWSVLVTLFGDMAATDGAHIPGPTLTLIGSEIGLRPEALRVALHRLRKDGWLTADKVGRTSQYRLSDRGRAETLDVSGHIYRATVPAGTEWWLTIPNPASFADPDPDSLPVAPGILLASRPPADQDTLLARVNAQTLPRWVTGRVMAAEITQRYAALHSVLSGHPIPRPDLPPLERLGLRILVLHHWRRTALQHLPEAASLMGTDWSGTMCRDLVHRWLKALPRPDLDNLTA
ncbi:hypothetical protein [Actibacterium sp. 188UL27-1]|uniref:hypothetical protein n=1 Tax=Actibacterium sp. 188UL27-1 TaxID=2786961 RepID=UPI00195CCB40|nr:hypothetical protein [Actibacterium sp. 188UL27-1]MBM7067384.1 hypothetical protein [Actibacterium sp. 188UL27-1]